MIQTNNSSDAFAFSSMADSTAVARIDSAAHAVKNKKIELFRQADLEKPYMLKYDSAKFSYSMDSASVKAYKMGNSIEQIAKGNGLWSEPIPNMLKQHDGIFLSLLICFLIICRILQRGHNFFMESIQMLVTLREKKDTFNEITIKEIWGSLFLGSLSAFLISLIFYQFIQQTDHVVRPLHHDWQTVVGFTVVVSVFFLVKYLFYSLVGYVFSMKEFIESFRKTYLMILEMFGLLAFIPALIYLYNYNFQHLMAIVTLVLFVLSHLILFSRLIAFFFNKKVNFLFGIAYLCSVEIVPYIYLAFGLSFLYKEDFFCIL